MNEKLKPLVKRGATSIANVVLDDEQYAKMITEQEFTEILMEEARKEQKLGESPQQSFARMFSADSLEGMLLRKAHAAIRKANYPGVVTVAPTQVGGAEATTGMRGQPKAYDQLVRMTEELRLPAPPDPRQPAPPTLR
jgi:hypothetical protein